MANTFISYNRRSVEVVATLANDIEALGHSAWYDQDGLSGGQVWWEQILANIRACDIFVFALSPAALESTACRREYEYAADLGKSILPVLVADGISPNLLPTALSRIQFVDYRAPDRKVGLRLARAFLHLPLSKPLPDPLPPPPAVPISYLASLTERVDTVGALSYEQQSALLIELKRSLRDPDSIEDAGTLIRRLRKRHDLFATIADEINEMIANPGQTPVEASPDLSTPASPPRQTPQQQSTAAPPPSVRKLFPPDQPSGAPRAAHAPEPTPRERWRAMRSGVALGVLLGIALIGIDMILSPKLPSLSEAWVLLSSLVWPGGLLAAAGAFAGSRHRSFTVLVCAIVGWIALGITVAAQADGVIQQRHIIHFAITFGGFFGAPIGAFVGGVAVEIRRRFW